MGVYFLAVQSHKTLMIVHFFMAMFRFFVRIKASRKERERGWKEIPLFTFMPSVSPGNKKKVEILFIVDEQKKRKRTDFVRFLSLIVSVIYERNNPIATSMAYWRLLWNIHVHVDFKYSILFTPSRLFLRLSFSPFLSVSSLCSIYSCFVRRNSEEKFLFSSTLFLFPTHSHSTL